MSHPCIHPADMVFPRSALQRKNIFERLLTWIAPAEAHGCTARANNDPPAVTDHDRFRGLLEHRAHQSAFSGYCLDPLMLGKVRDHHTDLVRVFGHVATRGQTYRNVRAVRAAQYELESLTFLARVAKQFREDV